MNKRYPHFAALIVGMFLLNGCASVMATPTPVSPAATLSSSAALPSATANAAVPDAAGSPNAATVVDAKQLEAASMVCSTEAKATVTKILGLSATPKTTNSWDGRNFVCSYMLPDGIFQMSVEAFPEDQAAIAGAKVLAESLNAAPIVGLTNLGLPGYQSEAGNVVFAKDNFSLHVDATKMKASVGVNDVTRSAFSYQMATTILGCWTH